MVNIVDHQNDGQITSLWTSPADTDALADFHGLPQHYGSAPTTTFGLWRHSLDPKNEQGMPLEYKHWERWSNHFEDETKLRVLGFDMESDCTNCNLNAWDFVSTPSTSAIQCRSCGHTPTECGSSRFASSRFSSYTNCSRPSQMFPEGAGIYDESQISEAENDDALPELEEDDGAVSSIDEEELEEGITEKDFASVMPPKSPSIRTKRRSALASVRQSIVQPILRRPRWFEAEDNITFQFKLTPRSGPSASAQAAAVPKANQDGSSAPSSQPPSTTAAPSTRGIPIRELNKDPTAMQRLLTSALFLIKEDNMPLQPGQSKVLDLGLASSRKTGGKHLAMKHQSSQDYQETVQSSTDPAKRIRWRVVVKPVQKASVERGSLLPR